MNKDRLPLPVAILSVVLICVLFWIGSLAVAHSKHLAKIDQVGKDLDIVLANRDQGIEVDKIDPWGTSYMLMVTSKEEDVLKTYVAVSAGPDKQIGTSDDITKQNRDLNWTNAGNVVGTKTGRLTRGFFRGLWQSGDGK